jgi:hypothetical protein
MDQETRNAFADLRRQLGQLRSALGVSDPDEAEQQVGDMKGTLGQLTLWAMGDPNRPFEPSEPS